MYQGEKQVRRLSRTELLGIPLASSVIVIAICLGVNKNFFNIDDAVAEYLPFFTQMGRIWSAGKFPFITDNTLIGSNALVELSHCAFTPQTILASLLAWHCEYKQVAAIFLAFFNMALMSASCLLIGNLYRLRPTYSWLFSVFCIIQPEFLLLYCRSWYNSASAQAWFVAAIATFLLLAHRASLKNFLLNFFSVLFLLSTNFAFAILAYGLFGIIFLIFHLTKAVRFSPLAILALANILAFLCVLPLYSEYIYNADLHDRFFTLNNKDNFGIFPWSAAILTFLPTYFDYTRWWINGYTFLNIPFAFSTIFVPLIFFNRKFFHFWRLSSEVRFFACLVLVYFICSQLPANFASMRCHVRFLPFYAFILCLGTSFILQYAERKNSGILSYSIFVLVCLLLSVSKSLGQDRIFINLQFISAALLFFIFFADRKNIKNSLLYPLVALLVLLTLIADTDFTKKNTVPIRQLTRKIDLPHDFNHDGYIFTSYNKNSDTSSTYETAYWTFGRLKHMRTINGQTPLGYKNWNKFASLNAHQSLHSMLVPVPGTDMCRANAWRISTLVLPAEVAQKNLERLEKCGYAIGADTSAAPMVYATLPSEKTRGWEKLPPASFPPLPGIIHESHEDAFDRLSLPARGEPVKLVFPRLYWHGFRAALNGERLDVTPDESGFLTSVSVPPGPAGTLEFWFFPETWRTMWVCPVLALIGLLCCSLYIRRRRPAGFWTPDIPR